MSSIVHRSPWPKRVVALACALGMVGASTVGSAPRSRAADADASVTKTKTVTRRFTDGGKTTTVASKKVSFTVSQTKDVRSLQLVNVSWKGAQPTGALVPDQNSDRALQEEYPFAIFECRGDDSSAHPITPNTCWTQFADERFTSGSDDPPYPAWRGDSVATPTQRAAVVGSPPASRLSAECKRTLAGTTVQRWVPFEASGGTTYAGGPFGCAGLPPEAAPTNLETNVSLPSNETFGITAADGTGSTAFDVFTGEDHASLGCSQTVACSIVAVPVMGLSCDPEGSELPSADRPDADSAQVLKDACEAGPRFPAGSLLPTGNAGEPAVSGAYWWSPSNWNNRISVPLTFAPREDACALDSTGTPVDVYGSEAMVEATTSWAPHFCLDKSLFNLRHVQTPEPQARSLLSINNIEAAYTSQPPDSTNPYPSPTVNAPVAITGFGIAYTFDDDNGTPVRNLRLDARLLAKLITASYPSTNFVQAGHPGETNNPLNITYDPEFRALNPGIPESNAFGAATLFAPNTDSDVIQAMTAYINADPEARAWLDGKPDPWGMQVNPFYKGIALPISNLPLLDTYEPKDYYATGLNYCLKQSPTPYLPLVASPTASLFTIAQSVEFALSPSQTICKFISADPNDPSGAKLVAVGRQASGHHALLGLVTLGYARRDGLTVASLESHTAADAPEKFTDGTGRDFAEPDTDGLRSAAKNLQPDAKTGTWPIPYDTLRSAANNSTAYPGLMVIYAAIPTEGIPNGDGPRYAKVLDYAAGDGQRPGTSQGELPPGFLPMTSANGLGQLVAYTERAAKAVGAQQGYTPSLTKPDPASTSPSPSPSPSASAGASHTASTGGGSSGGDTGATSGGSGTGGSDTGSGTGVSPGTSGGGTPTARPTTSSPAPSVSGGTAPAPVNAGLKTARVASGVGAWVLPVLLLVAIAAFGLSLAVRIGSRGR